MANDITHIMAIFRGHMGAHGTHGEPYQEPNKSKWEIKRTAKTLREPVTEELWEQHLKGIIPLGIISITEENVCHWGSIDVDKYDLDWGDLIKKVQKAKFPLVPCLSKSGGLHLFLFLSDPQPAGAVQTVLRDMAASLGLAGSEIFPKQTHILTDRGDLGSWMVMPYFGGTFGGKLKEQVGIKATGMQMSLKEFLHVAEETKVSAAAFQRLGSRKKANGKDLPDHFIDGPPCLEHLANIGFPEGTRNNTLFHMGVYYRKREPGGWKEALRKANQEYMRPPLTDDELSGVIKSLDKKTYEYTCKVEPMCSHCDSQLCRTRRHGVGDEGNFPMISGISKLDIRPAVWFVDVSGVRLELTTEQIQNYYLFHRACIEEADQVFQMMKPSTWLQVLAEAMENMIRLEGAPELGIEGRFREALESFVTSRARGESREDILLDRPWEDEETQRFYFKMKALTKFLRHEDMRDEKGNRLSRAKMASLIHDLGGSNGQLSVKGYPLRVWWVPSDIIEKPPSVDPSPVPGVPI